MTNDRLPACCPGSGTSADPHLSPPWADRVGSPSGQLPALHRLTPRASETGESDAKGQVMSKAGANWLRDQLVQSANTARQIDPELGRIYYTQMVERGAHHNKALCIVAAHLAERAWVTICAKSPTSCEISRATPSAR